MIWKYFMNERKMIADRQRLLKKLEEKARNF